MQVARHIKIWLRSSLFLLIAHKNNLPLNTRHSRMCTKIEPTTFFSPYRPTLLILRSPGLPVVSMNVCSTLSAEQVGHILNSILEVPCGRSQPACKVVVPFGYGLVWSTVIAD